jgi:hypothetical protein
MKTRRLTNEMQWEARESGMERQLRNTFLRPAPPGLLQTCHEVVVNVGESYIIYIGIE